MWVGGVELPKLLKITVFMTYFTLVLPEIFGKFTVKVTNL